MSQKDNFVFKCLLIIAWIIFVGLSIEAGGLVVNFFFSLYKPEMVPNLYQKLDLSTVYHQSEWVFYGMYSFILVISILKSYLFYVVVMLLHKMELDKPFSVFVSEQILKISYLTFSIGMLSYIAQKTAHNMQHAGYAVENLTEFWVDSNAYILMSAVIYVIAVIFARGVEMQKENDLTI